MKKRYPITVAIVVIIIAIYSLAFKTIDTPTDYSDMEGLNFPTSFEEYIEPYGVILDDDLFDKLDTKYNILYKQINDDTISEDVSNEYINEFNTNLREMGYPLPFVSFSTFLNSIKDLTNEDKSKLISLYDVYFYNDDYKESEKMIGDILKKYNLNGIEVLDQLSSYTYKFAIFSVDGNSIKLDDSLKTNVKTISKEKEELYLKIINRVFQIAPSSIKDKISTVEFSTDGLDRNLAYVSQDTDYTKFRLSIDEKDAIDEKGNFTQDGLETLIHEFGHIVTLNIAQINSDELNNEIVDITKSYKDGSYLNDFYNQFWKDIYEDYSNYNNGDFYKKYKDQFVTDYAATHIDEDIAESFRVYVFDIETKDNTVASQKVNFFNNYPELVQLKDHFRQVLNL